MGANIGTAVAPPMLRAIMLLFGWRWMFVTMGIFGLGASVVWFWLYREPDKAKLSSSDIAYLAANQSGRGSKRVTLRQWRRLFRFRATWGMILGAFCSGYGVWMYVTWLPGCLEGEHHISIAPAIWHRFHSSARSSARSAAAMHQIAWLRAG